MWQKYLLCCYTFELECLCVHSSSYIIHCIHLTLAHALHPSTHPVTPLLLHTVTPRRKCTPKPFSLINTFPTFCSQSYLDLTGSTTTVTNNYIYSLGFHQRYKNKFKYYNIISYEIYWWSQNFFKTRNSATVILFIPSKFLSYTLSTLSSSFSICHKFLYASLSMYIFSLNDLCWANCRSVKSNPF